MRSVTPALAAAIEAPERIVDTITRIDWDNDGSNTIDYGDTFAGRTNVSGWGSTSTGYPYTLTSPATDYGVSGGVATHTVTSAGSFRRSRVPLASLSVADQNILVEWSCPLATGASLEPANMSLRQQDTSNDYLLRVLVTTSNAVQVAIFRNFTGTAGGTTMINNTTIPGLVYTAATHWYTRYQAIGSTIRIRVWQVGTTEPAIWHGSVRDRTFTTGGWGLRSGRSSGNTNTNCVFSYYSVTTSTSPLDDVTAQVESWTIARSVTGSVPDQTQVIEGIAAATGTGTLTGKPGDETLGTVPYWSRFNPDSPIAGKSRVNRRVDVSTRWLTADGWQSVPRLTDGVSQAIPVDAAARTAQLAITDGRDRLRQLVRLPGMIADAAYGLGFVPLQPGLEASWVASYAAYQCGLYLAPPPQIESGLVRFYMPCHGSATAFIAKPYCLTPIVSLWADASVGYSTGQVCTFSDDAPFFMSLDPTSPGTGKGMIDMTAITLDATSATENMLWDYNGRANCRLYLWVKVTGDEYDTVVVDYSIATEYGTALSLKITKTGAVSAVVSNSGVDRTVAGPTITLDQWVFVGVHVDDAAGRAAFRVGTTTTVTTFTATPADYRYLPLTATVGLQTTCKVAELMVRAGCGETGIWPDITYVADFELDRLQNRELTGIYPPDTPQEAWDLLQELVAPERGLVWVDYDGILRIWSRARLNASDSTTVQRTLTTADHLWDLGYDDSRVMIRNEVEVGYEQVTAAPNTPLWSLTGVTSIEAGQTLVWKVTFEPHGGGDLYLSGSWAQNSDGTGDTGTFDSGTTYYVDDVVGTLTIDSATSATITLKAAGGSYTKWFVDNAGVPSVFLIGTPMARSTDRPSYTARSAESTAKYGPLPIAVDSNAWRQSLGWAKGEAHHLLALLCEPQVVFTDLSAPLDPRLEPWDRIAVVDAEGLHLDVDLHVEAIQDDLRPGQADMSLVGRQTHDQWVLGAAGVGTTVGNTVLGGTA